MCDNSCIPRLEERVGNRHTSTVVPHGVSRIAVILLFGVVSICDHLDEQDNASTFTSSDIDDERLTVAHTMSEYKFALWRVVQVSLREVLQKSTP